jgi:hypothetical protein
MVRLCCLDFRLDSTVTDPAAAYPPLAVNPAVTMGARFTAFAG